jgi:restriction endonuclease
MGVLLIAGVSVFIGFLLIALIGRTAPENVANLPPGAVIEHGWLSQLGPNDFAKLLALLFAELKFDVERNEVDGKMIDLFAVNPTPITGGRIYVRGVYQAPLGMVGEEEVRIAVDTARAEMAGKAIVATSGGFTDEAKAAAAGNSVDLLDGAEILRLTKKHLPGVAVARRI